MKWYKIPICGHKLHIRLAKHSGIFPKAGCSQCIAELGYGGRHYLIRITVVSPQRHNVPYPKCPLLIWWGRKRLQSVTEMIPSSYPSSAIHRLHPASVNIPEGLASADMKFVTPNSNFIPFHTYWNIPSHVQTWSSSAFLSHNFNIPLLWKTIVCLILRVSNDKKGVLLTMLHFLLISTQNADAWENCYF